jgi:hypothetical protein
MPRYQTFRFLLIPSDSPNLSKALSQATFEKPALPSTSVGCGKPSGIVE